MLGLGQKFPEFKKTAIMADKSFGEVSSQDHIEAGKWMVIFFYPKDFTLNMNSNEKLIRNIAYIPSKELEGMA